MNKKQSSKINIEFLNKILAEIPPVEKFSSRREWEKVCWQKILKSKELLPLLFTSSERCNFVKRAGALKGLVSGKSYRQISKELFVSLQTIGEAKKIITNYTYKGYSERSKTERKKKVYSPMHSSKQKSKHRGRAVPTKYGTVYIPY